MTLTDKEVAKIMVMRGCGYSQQEIADKIGCSRKTIENHLHKIKQESESVDCMNLFMEKVFSIHIKTFINALLDININDVFGNKND